MYSLSDTNCTNSNILSDSTDNNPELTTKVTSNTATSTVVTNTHGQIITVIMTLQPAHAKTSDSTGLIAAVAASAVIVLLGIVIVLAVLVLLVKKRYSNVMKE